MIFIRELLAKRKFDVSTDRLGPDVPFTHWRLYFKSTMRALCEAKFARFGEGAEFRPGAYAINCSNISIGDRVILRPGSMLFGHGSDSKPKIIIENDALIGASVHIYVDNHSFRNRDTPIIDQGYTDPEAVTVCSGAWVGAGAILLPGVTIERNAVVGAGSVVSKDVPANTVVVGAPAKAIERG